MYVTRVAAPGPDYRTVAEIERGLGIGSSDARRVLPGGALPTVITGSSSALRQILSGGNRSPSRRLLRQIAAATHALSVEACDQRAASVRIREFAQAEARKIGIVELARRLGADPSNLRKAINGTREFGLELQSAARRYRSEEH
jgi:transcriptional regulator with XRE-family HTH domain